MLNNAVLVGRLTRDIELRKTTTGKVTTTINIAVTRPYKNAEGVYETDFINCEIWGNVAQNCADYLKKGDLIGIKGTIRTESYEVNGEKKYRTYILGEKVTFLNSKKEEKKEDPFQKMHDKIENDLPVDKTPW